MRGLIKALAILLIVICSQTLIYYALIRPHILSWGATEQETAAVMIGDDLAPFTSSTRAIAINAPPEAVWSLIARLGSDRDGFYSYGFLETLYGYESSNKEGSGPKDFSVPVGRVVPVTPPDAQGNIDEGFRILAVESGEWVLLEGWGPLTLQQITPGKTRLLVRTQGWDLPGLISKLKYLYFMPMHYIMERKMMLEIKARAEAGGLVQDSSTSDLIWVLGVWLSLLGLVVLIFVSPNWTGLILASFFGVLWQVFLLVLDPNPVYCVVLFLLILASIIRAARVQNQPDSMPAR